MHSYDYYMHRVVGCVINGLWIRSVITQFMDVSDTTGTQLGRSVGRILYKYLSGAVLPPIRYKCAQSCLHFLLLWLLFIIYVCIVDYSIIRTELVVNMHIFRYSAISTFEQKVAVGLRWFVVEGTVAQISGEEIG